MRDWLNWTKALALIAALLGVWAGLRNHNTMWTICWIVCAALVPVNLAVTSYRHWQKGQRDMFGAKNDN